MVFSSTFFLFLFLPLTLVGYYLIRRELRNAFLLLMSLIFYGIGEPSFVFVMMASILVNYLLGLAIGASQNAVVPLRRFLLVLAVGANLSLLFYYKYFDFAVGILNRLFGVSIPLRHIALPIGISFFTFQGMSYVLDVYLKKTSAQKNPIHVALYIALFPQLIAGPIVRYTEISREIKDRKETMEDFASGVTRFSFGLAKKAVLANTFALLADQTFATAPEELGAGLAWLGALAYTLQIYFDFSGYSDMAIGLGRMFGFHFQENFRYPYTATSVREFWRRWHISLSSWFRDYVYIPLGGSRKGNVYLHLLLVFFLTGLWHGADWKFVLWGMWHGCFLILERWKNFGQQQWGRKKSVLQGYERDSVLQQHQSENNAATQGQPDLKQKKWDWLRSFGGWVYTMLIVVFGWVLFRAEDLSYALRYIGAMFGRGSDLAQSFVYTLQDYGVIFLVGIFCVAPILPFLQNFLEKHMVSDDTKSFKGIFSMQMFPIIQILVCVIVLLLGIAYTVAGTYNPFIYFNF